MSVVRSFSDTTTAANHGSRFGNVLLPIYSDPNANNVNNVVGEFKVELAKVNGSLGFSLTNVGGDHGDSVMRHTVKALVKEPALSDGRIRPGDKLIAANDVDCDALNHEELIRFLRKCPPTVRLTFYRDASRCQTPLTPEANVAGLPLQDDLDLAFHRRGKQLRYEAKEMVRSRQASRSSLDKISLDSGTLNRRARTKSPHSRLLQETSPAFSASVEDFGSSLTNQGSNSPIVESPMSPSKSLVGKSLSAMEFTSLPPLYLPEDDTMQLRIEELDLNDSSEQQSGVVEISECDEIVEQNQPPLVMKRPQDLNLTSSSPRRVAYQFFSKSNSSYL